MAYIYHRAKTFWVGYKLHGRAIRKSLHVTSRAAAKLLLSEYQVIEAREANQTNILTLKRNLTDVIEEYLIQTNIGKARLTKTEKVSTLKRFQEYLDGRIINVEEVSLRLVESYFMERYKVSISGANKDLKVIKHLLNYAVSRGYLYSNPAASLKKIKPVKKIFRDLSFEDVGRLLETAQRSHPSLYPIIAAAYYLGLRSNELVFLEWKDVNFSNNSVHVRSKPENRVKDCEERMVPLNEKLKLILQDIPKRDRFIFTTPSGSTWKNNLYREFQKIVRDAGLSDVSIQTLRETFGSHLLRKGVSIYLVSKYLGHSSVDVTTRHYAHIAIELTHESVNVL